MHFKVSAFQFTGGVFLLHHHPIITKVIYDLTLETRGAPNVLPSSVEEGFCRQNVPSTEIVLKHQLVTVEMKWECLTFQACQQCAP